MKRRLLLLAIAVASVVATGYLVIRSRARIEGQPDTSAASEAGHQGKPALARAGQATKTQQINLTTNLELPPAQAPLADTFATLKQLADRGDAAAASRLYQQLTSCNKRPALERMLTNEIAQMQTAADAIGATKEDRAQLRTNIEKRRGMIAQLFTRCDGVDAAELAELSSISLEAAQLGDAEARTCYIHRGPMTNPHAALANPELFSEYAANVAPLIDAALAQGDWRVVDMLRYAYGPGGNALLSGHTGTDPAMQYRYTRLFRLGATDAYRISTLDADLARQSRQLDPAQVVDADAWAQRSYEEHFNTSSTDAVERSWDACELSIHL